MPRAAPFEVLDDVGDVGVVAFDPRLLERLIEQAPGRADERPSLEVLTVARLLAHEHHRRLAGAFAEHRLRRVAVERARGAAGGGAAQRGEREASG